MGCRRQLVRSGLPKARAAAPTKVCVASVRCCAHATCALVPLYAPRSLVHRGASMLLSKVYILPQGRRYRRRILEIRTSRSARSLYDRSRASSNRRTGAYAPPLG